MLSPAILMNTRLRKMLISGHGKRNQHHRRQRKEKITKSRTKNKLDSSQLKCNNDVIILRATMPNNDFENVVIPGPPKAKAGKIANAIKHQEQVIQDHINQMHIAAGNNVAMEAPEH